MSAWLFQDHRQKQNLGDKCPWSVGWIDPEGKRKSKRIGAKSLAEKFARKMEGQLAAGTYQDVKRKGWAEFRTDYETKVASATSSGNQLSIKIALDHFQRLVKPISMAAIKTTTIDTFRAARQAEGVSVATVNKELRHIKAALRVGHEWKLITEVPKVRMFREPEKIPRFVTQEHFTAIYNACDAATEPSKLPCPAGDWWRYDGAAIHDRVAHRASTGPEVGRCGPGRRDCQDSSGGQQGQAGRDHWDSPPRG